MLMWYTVWIRKMIRRSEHCLWPSAAFLLLMRDVRTVLIWFYFYMLFEEGQLKDRKTEGLPPQMTIYKTDIPILLCSYLFFVSNLYCWHKKASAVKYPLPDDICCHKLLMWSNEKMRYAFACASEWSFLYCQCTFSGFDCVLVTLSLTFFGGLGWVWFLSVASWVNFTWWFVTLFCPWKSYSKINE